MIRFLDDLVDKVGGVVNFFLCVIIANILASATMMFLASVIALWIKMR